MRTSPWHAPERDDLRKTVRAFAEREILPYAQDWERTGEIPRELHAKAGAAGPAGRRPTRSRSAAAAVTARTR